MGKRGFQGTYKAKFKGKKGAKKRRSYVAPTRQAQAMMANAASRGLLGIEKKWRDFLHEAVVPQPAVAKVIDHDQGDGGFQVHRGDGVNERNGARITVTNFNLKGRLSFRAPVVSLNSTTDEVLGECGFKPVRVWLVLDTQTNGTKMSGSNFMLPTSSVDPTLNFRKVENTQRFKVLAVTTVTPPQPSPMFVNDTGNTIPQWVSAESPSIGFSLNYNAKPIVITGKAGGSTDTIANVIDNSIHVLIDSNQPYWGLENGTTEVNPAYVHCKYQVRMRYFG